MTLRQWLENLAMQLGDYHPGNASLQFQHWPRSLLLSYYNEAACAIASAKPADYIKSKVIKLVAGSTQTSPCALVGAVTEVTDCHGNHIAFIIPLKKTPTWRGRSCETDSYLPTTSYRVDGAPSSFEVYPPVPSGADTYVRVRCVEPPTALTDADLDSAVPSCKYSAALTQWALFRALSGDSDTTLASNSQTHYKAFFDLLGIQMKADAVFLERPTK